MPELVYLFLPPMFSAVETGTDLGVCRAFLGFITSFLLPPSFPVQFFFFVCSILPNLRAVMTACTLDEFDIDDRRITRLGHGRGRDESRFISS